MGTAASETPAEKRVWELLVQDFRWDPPDDFGIKVARKDGEPRKPDRLQIFEAAITATFARLRPDYEWQVTPNLAGDGGIDFIGKQPFLTHEAYGIAAAITVGGQCKKHRNPGTIHHEIAGSLIDMAETISPTFFVVAFSAHISKARIEKARQRVESQLQRHCHILDRPQIEGLLIEHLSVLEQVLAASDLGQREVGEVREYFSALQGIRAVETVEVEAPEDARAGEPFNVHVSVRSTSAAALRLYWKPALAEDGGIEPVELINPVAAATSSGVELKTESLTDDPFLLQASLELRSHAVGRVNLGAVKVEPSEEWTDLGRLRIADNVRPRFFEPPFQAQLRCLGDEYARATAGKVVSVGVLGAGGSGKSRVCEEFAVERRRRGCAVITAKQTKSRSDPHLMLAELFLGLIGKSISYENASDSVLDEVAHYDRSLAERSEPSIRSIFAAGEQRSGSVNEEGILSTLLLLTMVRARVGPLIIHLQDLHWSSADVLGLLRDFLWQLDRALADSRTRSAGVFFIFEGRIREKQVSPDEGWDSRPFETFLQQLDCRTTLCSSLDREQGHEFITRLFETGHTARRRVNDHLLDLQRELIEEIDRSAGGNPFHSLEQVRLLRELGVVAQNPETGFFYISRPQPPRFSLPDRIFESIRLRWQYMRERTPELALLVWALALLDDRVPTPLFQRLRRELAPDVPLPDLNATDLIQTGDGEGREVSFRHENYFRALRNFDVCSEDREKAIDVYSEWFEEMENPDPANKFRWARVLLERSKPDRTLAGRLLGSAEREARRQGDLRLARRVLITSLDAGWEEDARSSVEASTFLRLCDEELALVRDLLGNDRGLAGDRLATLRNRIEGRLASGGIRSETAPEFQRRLLVAEVRRSQHLFNDYRPAKAAEVATQAISGLEEMRSESGDNQPEWELLKMEALHSQAVSLALSGELEPAREASERAVAIARDSRPTLAGHVICTHAAILLATDPVKADGMLRDFMAGLDGSPASGVIRDEAELDLSESLILQAYACGSEDSDRRQEMVTEARSLLRPLFTRCFQLGQYPDAGAAALLLGVISAMEGNSDEVSWFAQAVAAASRGGHVETLWRAHIDLATAMHRHGEPIHAGVRQHALAASEIMEETMSSFAQPCDSMRFQVLRCALAQATRLLLLAGDDRGTALMERYPRLGECFEDLDHLVLLRGENGHRHYQWLPIETAGYMLY